MSIDDTLFDIEHELRIARGLDQDVELEDLNEVLAYIDKLETAAESAQKMIADINAMRRVLGIKA